MALVLLAGVCKLGLFASNNVNFTSNSLAKEAECLRNHKSTGVSRESVKALELPSLIPGPKAASCLVFWNSVGVESFTAQSLEIYHRPRVLSNAFRTLTESLQGSDRWPSEPRGFSFYVEPMDGGDTWDSPANKANDLQRCFSLCDLGISTATSYKFVTVFAWVSLLSHFFAQASGQSVSCLLMHIYASNIWNVFCICTSTMHMMYIGRHRYIGKL